MPALNTPFVHLKNVLNEEDLSFLRSSYKRILNQENMPCFALIDLMAAPTFLKIKTIIEEQTKQTQYYLNDFYMYTDSSSKAGWHMDTELFTFQNAINAWILLSPDAVDSPLGLIDQINDTPDRCYHSVTFEEDKCSFGNYCTGGSLERSLTLIEDTIIPAPGISLGDILLFNPKRFHKTNTNTAKHGCAIKFVSKENNKFLSDSQVDPYLWPEVEIFNNIVKQEKHWDTVLHRIREFLKTPDGKKTLSSGFYPDKFDLYKTKIQEL